MSRVNSRIYVLNYGILCVLSDTIYPATSCGPIKRGGSQSGPQRTPGRNAVVPVTHNIVVPAGGASGTSTAGGASGTASAAGQAGQVEVGKY